MEFSSKKVLIVEDDPLLSMVEERLVQKMGHKVVATFDNGQATIEEVRKQVPDLILMDIRLNGKLDGIETVREIKKEFFVPVIYLSGSTYPKGLERAREIGFTYFLEKPVRMTELKKAFQNVFENEKVVRSQKNKRKVG